MLFLYNSPSWSAAGFTRRYDPGQGKVPIDLACSEAASTQAHDLHQRVTKGASWILIWVDSGSSGFILTSTFAQLRGMISLKGKL
jgi:hypothetical protein